MLVFITGASSGIGEACARAFAELGHDLILAARRRDRLEGLGRELGARGVKVSTFVLDVRDEKAVARLFESQASLFSGVDVLVNNAGLAKGLDTIQEGKLDDWQVMLDTNVKGLLVVTRQMLPHFIRRRSGHVINLGSVASRWAYPRGNVYMATKRAVSALTEGLRLDLLGTGIRVTEVSPGLVETEFSLVRFGDAEKAKTPYQGMTPLTAKDVADAVVWSALRPPHVNVQEIVLYPTEQAAPAIVHRAGKN